jgi:hypothetical protein
LGLTYIEECHICQKSRKNAECDPHLPRDGEPATNGRRCALSGKDGNGAGPDAKAYHDAEEQKLRPAPTQRRRDVGEDAQQGADKDSPASAKAVVERLGKPCTARMMLVQKLDGPDWLNEAPYIRAVLR